MAEEINNFVKKFQQLKNAGTKSFLWMESQAGEALVILQAHLPVVREDIRYREGSSHPPHRWEDLRHPRHPHHPSHPRYPRRQWEDPCPKRATPSRVRRRVRRELARADARVSADAADVVAEHVTLATENVDVIPPYSSPPQPDAQPKEEAVQAPPQPDAQTLATENVDIIPNFSLPPQPNSQPNERAVQAPPPLTLPHQPPSEAALRPPPLAAGNAAPLVIENVRLIDPKSVNAYEPPCPTPAWPGHYLPQDFPYHHHHPGLAQAGGLPTGMHHMVHTRAGGQADQLPPGTVADSPTQQLELSWVVESGSGNVKKKKGGRKKHKNSVAVKLDASYLEELEKKLNEPLELV